MLGLDKVVKVIENALDSIKVPAPELPEFLTWCVSVNRGGMSATRMAADVISKNEQCGIPTNKNPDGSENLYNVLCVNICNAVVNEIKENCVVDGVIRPGKMKIQATGGNAGGPIEVIGFNTNYARFKGIIQ